MISRLERQIDRVLAIGYGNPLRSDDGAGQQVAEILASWQLPQMRSIAVHQLTPELAAPIAEAEIAIFIDVYQVEANAANDIRVISIDPATYKRCDRHQVTGHIAAPHSLLYLTDLVYGKAPPAWWVLIPAVNFEFGDRLSTLTTVAIARAISLIHQLIQSHAVKD